MRVLLVEDDTMIGESIRKGLKHDGYSVDWVRDGQAAELAIDSEAIEHLKDGARRAARLVEQLLTMSRLAPEAAQRPPSAVGLDRLAAGVVADFEPLAAAHAIELRLDRVEPACVSTHENALRTLLGNLVDNAIRYTPAQGRVAVDAYRDAAGALLRVTDTGPGIPSAERGRVFDRFYRLPGSGTGGSGLGLAIVKQIADANRAAIDLSEGEDGRGLRVTVRFAPGEVLK